jgi:hypothetical protein
MTKILSGGCLCGHVRYEYTGEPEGATYCHCPDCKKTTGSAFSVGVRMQSASLHILSGNVKGYTKTGGSGNEITREFCPECGSPLFTREPACTHLVWVKAGSLDTPELIKPTHQIWTDMSVAWGYIDQSLPSFPKKGPPPKENDT